MIFALLGAAVVAAGTVVLASMAEGHNFSQYPGFAEHFEQHPPAELAANAAQQQLLHRFRPRLFAPAGHAGPVDFYKDYIAHGTLFDGEGNILSREVGKTLLNEVRERPDVEFVHQPPDSPYGSTPVIYGHHSTADIDLGDGEQRYTLLTYHATFQHSGLPAGLLGWQSLMLGLVGDLDDWHQLDHYTAVIIVLDAQRTPVAMLVQHHNYHRTHLFGEDVEYPHDNRVKLDISIRSNELYPHKPGRTNRPAVSFLTPDAWLYMIGAGKRLFLTADDITEPERELEYDLQFLAPSDAYYTFKGFLGEKRLLPGRSGPPGAYYKTLPKLMKFDRQLLVGYWRRGNPHDIDNLARAVKEQDYLLEYANAQGAVFRANLLCVKRWKSDCAFE